jgi:tRNA (guanine-N7-)-methyltransferase
MNNLTGRENCLYFIIIFKFPKVAILIMKRIPEHVIDKYLIKPESEERISFTEIFSNHNPVKIDIGSGNGHFIVDIALENRESNFIGIEIKFDRVCKTISKLHKRNIENVRLYHGDAFSFLKQNIKEKSVKEFYYNFPDPWPKRRHHKHRLFTPALLDELDRVMTDHAVFTCATDHKDYLDWMLNYIEKDSRFIHLFEDVIVNELDNYHTTLFEEIWRKMNKIIYYFRFAKKNSQVCR